MYVSKIYELLIVEDRIKPVERVLAVITALAVIYLLRAYASHVRKRKKIQHVFTRSMSLGFLHGGELALQRLVEYHDTRANFASVDAAETELETLLEDNHPNFKKLQSIVAKMEMCGKESIAVKKLEAASEKSRKEGKPHEAYEIEMLLVESLIYEAITHILLEHPRCEAKRCWKEFKEIRKQFQRPRTLQEKQIHGVVSSFSKFENLVKLLRDDIQNASKNVK